MAQPTNEELALALGRQRAGIIGATAGTVVGFVAWGMAAKIHPSGKYLGVILPMAGAYAGYQSWLWLAREQRFELSALPT